MNCTCFLVIALYWGLNNQIASFLRGMHVSKTLSCCLVAPHWYADYDNMDWKLLPTGYFYSIDSVVQQAALKGVTIVNNIPHSLIPKCYAQVANDRVKPHKLSLQQLEAWRDMDQIICLTAYNTLVGLQQHADDGVFPLYLDTLRKPSHTFQTLLDSAMQRLQHDYGTSKYITVQGRTEDDWRHACTHGFTGEKTIFKTKCFMDDASILKELSVNFKIPQDTLLFVPSFHSLHHFPALCAFYRCFNKVTAIQHIPDDIARHVTTSAFIDMLMSTRSTRFFGNIYSSFARMVSVILPNQTAYYNTPCGSEC